MDNMEKKVSLNISELVKMLELIEKMRGMNYRVLKNLYDKKMKNWDSIEDGRIDFYIGRNSQLDDIEEFLKEKSCKEVTR